jgi:hypothetical protein
MMRVRLALALTPLPYVLLAATAHAAKYWG